MHLKIVLAAALALLGAGAAQAATVKVEFSGQATLVRGGVFIPTANTITYGFIIDESQPGAPAGSATQYTPISSYMSLDGSPVANAAGFQTVNVSDSATVDIFEASFDFLLSDATGLENFSVRVELVDSSGTALSSTSLVDALSLLGSGGLSDFGTSKAFLIGDMGTTFDFDLTSVSVMAAVPLPASALLLGAGVLGLGAVGARRRKRAAA